MGRAPCCEKTGLKRGPWTPEEDQKLIDYIKKNGYGNWRTLPKNAGLQRCGKSCRLRWTNYLRPDIKRGRFTFEEEETIIQLHSILGNKWSAIATRLPGRTDNEIKNYWNTHIRKRLLRMGIDPVTHTARLDLSILSSSLYGYPSSHLNFSRLMQPLINPDLVRLATSLLSSDRRNQGFPMQNDNLNFITNQVYPSLPVQDLPIPTTQGEANQLMQYDAVERFGQMNEWQQNDGPVFSAVTEDYVPATANYGYYGSDQSVMDPAPSSETSTFQSNNNYSFQSVLSNMSTPSSSPTPFRSGSDHNNMKRCSTEYEMESYCSSMLKFEIPADYLDVADYI